MHIEIKSFDCSKHDPIENWKPEDADHVDFWMNFTIGTKDVEGGDNFEAHIMTKNALYESKNKKGKKIILEYYSFKNLMDEMNNILVESDDTDWQRVCENLNKYFYWEFDNYKN